MRTHIDLFSGIGGFALAARWAGVKTVQFVELDPFCQKVLNKNFPGVPIHDDIKTFTNTNRPKDDATQNDNEWGKSVINNGAEVRSFNSTSSGANRPFLLTGGFPCQPFSCAGKRKGTSDSRHLWPHMLRVIKEFKPKWIIGENVAGIINIKSMEQQDSELELESETVNDGSDNQPSTVLIGILNDLEQAGYSVQVFIIPACAVNAPHRRDRVWIVANRRCEYGEGTEVNRKLNRPLPCEKNAPMFERPISDDGKGINSNTTSGECFNGRSNRQERHLQDSAIGKIEENKSEWNRRLDRIEQTDSHAPDTDRNGLQEQRAELEADRNRQFFQTSANTTGRQNNQRNGRSMDTPERSGECSDSAVSVGDKYVTDTESRQRLQGHKNESIGSGGETRQECGGCAVNVSNSESERLERRIKTDREQGQESYDELLHGCGREWDEPWLEVAQRFCKLDDGLPDRLARPARNRNRVQKLKALGNAVVPQIPFLIMQAILKVENENG